VRVLHIDTGRDLRGGQRQVLLLLELLSTAGHECKLLARTAGLLRTEASRLGVAVLPATLRNVWSHSAKADIVHVHDAHAHSLAAVASPRPFVVSRRVAFAVRRSFVSRWKYRRARRFIAVSKFVAAQLYSAGIPSEKIDVVYDAAPRITTANEWSPDAPVVALANDDPMKGRDLVQLAAAKSGHQVVFSKDLSSDFRRASMFVYITRSEGLGSAALLAMSMGVPVIASRTGGLQEVFEDRISGLYVENEPAQIASAMCRITNDAEFACRLIREGRARVATQFNTHRLLEGTLASYARALGA